MTARPVYGLVLAGGQSRRMGSDKALLLRDGQSQLAHMVTVLSDSLDKVFVSARKDQAQDPERGRFNLIVDRYDDMGPVAGILSALEQHSEADWLVVACDLPNIDAATLTFLLQNRASDKPFTAFRSTHDDLPEPLCAIYRSGSDTIVRQFVDDGIFCPRKILLRSDTLLLEQPNPNSLHNVNTPDDLEESVLEKVT